MLTRNHQLTQQQLLELDKLCGECKAKDGNVVAVYKHILSQNRPRLCNVLYYHDKQLIGFLSTFFFYEDACEISVMVTPGFRRQHIATEMMQEILPLIQAENIHSLIFSRPHDLKNDWILAKGYQYLHSEYQMHHQQLHPISIENSSIVVRFAKATDVPLICAIDHACFPTPQPDLALHIQNLLYDPNYRILIAEFNGIIVGKAHLDLQMEGTRLSDIAILPPFQGRGLGSQLLAHCINYSLAVNQPKLHLGVEAKNQHALKIYIKLGFMINNAYDFWSIPIEVLRFAKH